MHEGIAVEYHQLQDNYFLYRSGLSELLLGMSYFWFLILIVLIDRLCFAVEEYPEEILLAAFGGESTGIQTTQEEALNKITPVSVVPAGGSTATPVKLTSETGLDREGGDESLSPERYLSNHRSGKLGPDAMLFLQHCNGDESCHQVWHNLEGVEKALVVLLLDRKEASTIVDGHNQKVIKLFANAAQKETHRVEEEKLVDRLKVDFEASSKALTVAIGIVEMLRKQHVVELTTTSDQAKKASEETDVVKSKNYYA
ncbi:hypothetical protein NE237_011060 [Protea cynaroides]|uniref:Uncharacterized protein n=1 Tax=Protea cynaroides TaxID=273540 RepID=A0A9Q0GU88_9MAGN|nr:hypothetical protein NE237_011060 [Protea cynaroides]